MEKWGGGKKEENQKKVYRSGQADWEGSLYEKVLTWTIPERTVTVAATITLQSSSGELLVIELL